MQEVVLRRMRLCDIHEKERDYLKKLLLVSSEAAKGLTAKNNQLN